MTVNSMMGAVMAFVRYCHRHGWIQSIPDVEKLEVDDVMKARPVTGEEFDRMIEVTPSVVGDAAADSWIFALRILWESGFRVGDLVDFSWDDERRIIQFGRKMPSNIPRLSSPPRRRTVDCRKFQCCLGSSNSYRRSQSRSDAGGLRTPSLLNMKSQSNKRGFNQRKRI